VGGGRRFLPSSSAVFLYPLPQTGVLPTSPRPFIPPKGTRTYFGVKAPQNWRSYLLDHRYLLRCKVFAPQARLRPPAKLTRSFLLGRHTLEGVLGCYSLDALGANI